MATLVNITSPLPPPVFLQVWILKNLRTGFLEVWKTKDLRGDDFGQNPAKHGVRVQVRIPKGLRMEIAQALNPEGFGDSCSY